MDLPQKIFQLIQKQKLMRQGDLVIIGLSGGPDSMALLSILIHLRHLLGLQLHAAHFNHKIRPAADEEQRFVAAWCKKNNISLTLGKRPGTKKGPLSEDQARQMRLQFFVKTAHKLKAQSVALAHTQNDLAETVLMRILRGSGLQGLRGILPVRTMEKVMFVRPLLETTRPQIEHYLKSHKIIFCQDTSNQQPVYLRNKIRLKLLPLLTKEYNAQVADALADLGRSVQDDYDFLSTHAENRFKESVEASPRTVKIELRILKREHPAIVRLMMRQMVAVLTKNNSSLTFDHVQDLQKLFQQDKVSQIYLPNRLRARRTEKFLEISYA